MESILSSKQLDDLNSSLNVVLASIKADTSKFPPLEILENIRECLECLANSQLLDQQRANYISLSWPADLRTVIATLFRTFRIPEEYTHMCYELCNVATQSLGSEWLKSDLQFARLLASLSSGRLRIIFDKPSEINMAQLISCLQLQEYFFSCVEDEQEWMSDEDASFIAKCCREAVVFVCERSVECAKETNIALRIAQFLPLYRFICAFLSIGGAEIIDKALLRETLPVLISVCKYCLNQRDASLAWYLLGNLSDFDDPLPSELLALFVQFVSISSSDRKEAKVNKSELLDQFCDLLEQFTDREGWYTEQSLADLRQLVSVNAGKERLNRIIQQIDFKKG